MTRAFLLLGSNAGDREALLDRALKQIDRSAGRVLGVSSIYETQPWGNVNQPLFLNQAVKIDTSLSPVELLSKVLDIERSLGRTRSGHWDPRTIDIDIIFYSDQVVNEADLTIPHPFMHARRFVLTPMAELAGEHVHPVLGKTVQQLLDECPDTLEVRIVSNSR